jgi:hypothetical protein
MKSVSIPTNDVNTLMGRKTTCSGCGYVQSTVTSYYHDRKMWNATHTLAFCKARKNEIFPGTLDALAKLGI